MTESELLDNALYHCATIHQPHALKAFLAAQNLSTLFATLPNEKMNVWQQTATLIAQSEMQVEGDFAQRVLAHEFSAFRIKKVLSLGIYPAAYQAVLQWHQTKGFSDIFEYYLNLAAHNNEYLSHNVTILLAFNRLYPQLDASQVMPFLDRLTEFITASFSAATTAPLNQNQAPYDFIRLLDVCLKQPSFFGHNLITLTWIIRGNLDMSETQLASLTHNLYQQATSPLDDPDDAMDEALFALSQSTNSQTRFYQNLQRLVFDNRHNLHQVTLADALLYLEELFPEERTRISCMADYYVRVFNHA